MNIKDDQSQLMVIARTAGIWYLMMAISGFLGFVIFHPQVYDADPGQTWTNLVEEEKLARIRLLLEVVIILSQALTALWFYRLFRNINGWASLATLIWGTVNAIVILFSAICMGAAIQLALSSEVMEDKVAVIDLLTTMISNAWRIGMIFFGLWLIPMGYIITSSKRMPVWLGRTLIIGGIGYVVSAVLIYSGISGSWVSTLTLPATVGEFWMIGYLLIFGIRPENEE